MAKPTKAQKAALRRSKERAAKRTIPPTKLDEWAIKIYECAQAMKRAGFDEATIQGWIVDHPMPDWFVNNPDHSPYEDDEEEDDD
jgi:hypothetical protein